MTLYLWSRTAATNGSADPSAPWPEGMAPASVNDSSRGGMAAVAKYRDDIAGAIVTAGTSTAYTVASYQVFDTLAHMANQMIAFTPHTTNGATVTLNVDGLGAKPLRTAPNAELLAGVLIQGTPYVATYNNSDAAWYLQGFFGNPYNIPLAGCMTYFGPTAPNSSFVLPFGQPVSRTTYSALFALVGATFGAGDGSTTFNLPDLRGRWIASPDNMGGGSDPNRLTSSPTLAAVRNSVGGTGGASGVTLSLTTIPTGITSSGTNAIAVAPGGSAGNFVPQNTTGWTNQSVTSTGASVAPLPNSLASTSSQNSFSGNNSISVTSNNTGGQPHENAPPTILANQIFRII